MIHRRYFTGKPIRASYEQTGCLMGDVTGVGMLGTLAWTVLRTLF